MDIDFILMDRLIAFAASDDIPEAIRFVKEKFTFGNSFFTIGGLEGVENCSYQLVQTVVGSSWLSILPRTNVLF